MHIDVVCVCGVVMIFAPVKDNCLAEKDKNRPTAKEKKNQKKRA